MPTDPSCTSRAYRSGGRSSASRCGVELLVRAEQRLAGHDVDVEAGRVVVPVRVVERRLGAGVLCDLVLEVRQLTLEDVV